MSLVIRVSLGGICNSLLVEEYISLGICVFLVGKHISLVIRGRGAHITRKLCFSGRGTHITKDIMCFPAGRGTHITREDMPIGKSVSLVVEHILLGISC